MTDETVGPELPAATGGWTNGRARGGASIRNRLCRPGRMLSGGREQAPGVAIPPVVESPLVCNSLIFIVPWERKDKEVRPGEHLILLLLQTGAALSVIDVTPSAEDR